MCVCVCGVCVCACVCVCERAHRKIVTQILFSKKVQNELDFIRYILQLKRFKLIFQNWNINKIYLFLDKISMLLYRSILHLLMHLVLEFFEKQKNYLKIP